MRNVVIIGSTGSIGENTLNVVRSLSDRFRVHALGVNSGVARLAEQVAEFKPKVVAIGEAERVDEFHLHCRRLGISTPDVQTGVGGLSLISGAAEADVVVSAAVGAAGLAPTYEAILRGKTVALANKEAMVLAGELLRHTAKVTGAQIIPIDSEHSALDQCLRAGRRSEVRRLILTASGGPFRETPLELLDAVTPEQALNHP